MNIKKGDNKFFIGEDELNPEGELIFDTDDKGDYVIKHTEVKDGLSGQGAGKRLVDTMVDFARQEDKKIKAECPFARSVMEKDDDYRQLLK
ncbi:GNAT family N-acetyltransferase [Salinicoccus carnicancri]|uniref:GNAT family N-acetyltransferase n=1 Tax=Salinicoccus carnicancri TaxID=558170 RepID=UPI0002F8EA72|nr:GNAT family N-acetyltransferase [Salinicoccus carnicancri]